ncbi:MAG: hypothetical protein Q7U76_10170 [Nitrospirota bacterium]|nr:hypothetical protein [Nitrospirota bacterium]
MNMTLLRSVGMALSVVLVPLTVSAASLPDSRADYSADSTMEADGGMTMKSRVYHTSGKERMEMGGAGGSVTIIRKDKKVMWQLMGDMYMEMPLDQSNASDLSAMDVEQTAVGEETINGIKTTKSKVIATKKDGSKFGGFFWTTKEGITVKMDLLSKEGDKKMRMASELTNLKIEKQDPALFEIPAGYTKNDMGAMMGQGGMPNMRDMMKSAEQEPAKDQGRSREKAKSKSAESDEIIDMNKMLKGLLGR